MISKKLINFSLTLAAFALLAGACHGANAFTSSELEPVALIAAKSGDVVRSSGAGQSISAVMAATFDNGCKLVGAWFDDRPRAVVNFTVCGNRAFSEGTVSHLPRTADTTRAVKTVLRTAVLGGTGRASVEEFKLTADRVGSTGINRCKAHLMVMSSGLLSSFTMEDVCN
jgi:hypothetical protein